MDEVCALRGFQEELAVRAPEDPRRVFGEAVEAAGAPSGEQLVRMCSEIVARALPEVLDKLTAHIDQRFSHLESRQRVNLNVRAPQKRPLLQDPPIASDIAGAGRPLPVSKFLDEKQQQDPTWKVVRKSFAPAFGMITQVMKKKRLRDEGAQPVYVEQNQRAQLLYTEADRELMQVAWELTTAHRLELAARAGNPQDAPALVDRPDRPSVMDLLQGRRE